MSDALRARVAAACMEMEKTLHSRMYSKFLDLEAEFYQKIVKAEETKSHYERCFNEFDRIGALYGDVLLSAAQKLKNNIENADYEGTPEYRVLYLLPNLDNDLAHIEHLYSILKNHEDGDRLKITIGGYRKYGGPIQSRYISELAKERRINVALFEDSHTGRLNLLRYFFLNRFDQLVIYSIPFQLSAWCRALGSNNVSWVSTKFRLDCFAEVRNRIIGGSEYLLRSSPSKWSWKVYPPSLEATGKTLKFNRVNRSRTRLVSINREEKIASPVFLEAVAAVLTSRPTTSFAWTGRRELESIREFFVNRGLDARVQYIGWVDPYETIGYYDIFLDTPALSGVVSARACFAGMPTVSFKSAGAWIENHEVEFARLLENSAGSLRKHKPLASSIEDYVEIALALIDSDENYNQRGAAQERIAREYFTDTKEMYRRHYKLILDTIS